LRSPKSRINAGTKRPRTIVASSITARATPKPIDLIDVTPLSTNDAKTTASNTAAAVMMRADLCRPIATASSLDFPASCSKYLEVNSAWNDEEAKHESYIVWGLSQDAQRFLLFLGRSACSGKVPASLLKSATEHWMQIEELNSKFTKQKLNVSEELAKLIQSTESLGLKSHELGVWSFGLLQIGEDEWVSEIPTKERLVAIHWIESKGSLQQISVWSDFHDETLVTILTKLTSPIDGKLAISTSHGLLLLSQRGESDLKELLELSF